jgi:hypothetical protein
MSDELAHAVLAVGQAHDVAANPDEAAGEDFLPGDEMLGEVLLLQRFLMAR